MCHRMAIKKIEMQSEALFEDGKGLGSGSNPINNIKTLLDLSGEPFLSIFNSTPNPSPSLGMLISGYCKEEGYC